MIRLLGTLTRLLLADDRNGVPAQLPASRPQPASTVRLGSVLAAGRDASGAMSVALPRRGYSEDVFASDARPG